MDVRSSVYVPSRLQAAAAQGIDKAWETQYTKNHTGYAKKAGEGFRKKICLQSKKDIERMRVV